MVNTLGDSLGIVSGVYIAVLIPWTLLYTLDFISSKWVCIKNTEIKGWVHLVIITIPISYIFAYIVFQTQLPEPDYKEMYAAVAALVLSAYHLARTVWGLRQVVYFKKWVRETARAMRDAGYEFELEPGIRRRKKSLCNEQHSLCGLRDMFRRILGMKDETVRGSQEISIDEVVRSMLVSNTLIDNEFNAGIADHVELVSWRRIFWLPLKPSKPMVTFTRWATAFIAQFGTFWLSDAIVNAENGDPWIDKRRNFALQVLTTAILQTDPFEDHSYYNDTQDSTPISKRGKSFLLLNAWEEISNSMDAWYVFSPPKILAAFLSGTEGLPYGCQVVDKGNAAPPRSLLKPMIKEAINALKPRMQEALENFGPEHLEMFAMFLWVQKNARNAKAGGNAGEDFKASEASYEFLQRQLGLDEDERALQNLAYPFCRHARNRHLWYNRNVLEVSCRIDNWLALSSGEQLCSLQDVLGENETEYDRTTTRSEELSVSVGTPSRASGEQRNVSEHMPLRDLEKSSDSRDIHDPVSGQDDVSKSKQGEKETCYSQNELLEKKRLRFQLGNDETYDYSEQSLTFMGCVMESLRSGLAEQVFTGLVSQSQDQKKETGSWTVPVPMDFLEFPISRELWRSLRERIAEGSLHSVVQERLLWECQVGTHDSFQGILREPDAHRRVASMMLFILGFPSVFIRRNAADDRGYGSIPVLDYAIHAAFPPQQIHVYVSIMKHKGNPPTARLRLVEEQSLEDSSGFQWNLWLDSFLGRIKAKADWQESHGMTQAHVNARSENDLSKPVSFIPQGSKKEKNRNENKLVYWEGWPPFREGLAIFELKVSLANRGRAEVPPTVSAIFTNELLKLSDEENKMRRGTKFYNVCPVSVLSNSLSYIDTALELGGPSVIWGKLKSKEEVNKPDVSYRSDLGRRSATQRPFLSSILPVFQLRNMRNMFPPGSQNSSPTRPSVEETASSAEEIATEARALNPRAMFDIARWVLKGTHGYRQSREQALIIMENAFQIEKDVDIALLYMKTCLEGASLYEAKRDENLDRAFSVVKMLWADVESRLRNRAGEDNDEIVKTESERVDQIIGMNYTMIREKRTSRTLQDFADRLTMWFHAKGDQTLRDRAITLYESAVIADGGVFAMLKLALLNATDDEEDTMKMALRLSRTATEKIKSRTSSLTDGVKGNRFDFKEVSVKSYTLRDVKDYINLEKSRGHPGAERLAKRMKTARGSYDRSATINSFDKVSSTTNAQIGGNGVIEESHDHTIVNVLGIEHFTEAEVVPPFPHPSYL